MNRRHELKQKREQKMKAQQRQQKIKKFTVLVSTALVTCLGVVYITTQTKAAINTQSTISEQTVLFTKQKDKLSKLYDDQFLLTQDNIENLLEETQTILQNNPRNHSLFEKIIHNSLYKNELDSFRELQAEQQTLTILNQANNLVKKITNGNSLKNGETTFKPNTSIENDNLFEAELFTLNHEMINPQIAKNVSFFIEKQKDYNKKLHEIKSNLDLETNDKNLLKKQLQALNTLDENDEINQYKKLFNDKLAKIDEEEQRKREEEQLKREEAQRKREEEQRKLEEEQRKLEEEQRKLEEAQRKPQEQQQLEINNEEQNSTVNNNNISTNNQTNNQNQEQTTSQPDPTPPPQVNTRTDGFNFNGYHFDTPVFYGSGSVAAGTPYIYLWGSRDAWTSKLHYLVEKISPAGDVIRQLEVGSNVVIDGITYQVFDIWYGVRRDSYEDIGAVFSVGADVTWQTCETNYANSTQTIWFANKI